jgi:hypothetical protein
MDTLNFASSFIGPCREIILQVTNTESRQKQITPQIRAQNWTIAEGAVALTPEHFVVFDDLLTGGSHFAAMKIVLELHFPGVPISGLFLARRVLPSQTADPGA